MPDPPVGVEQESVDRQLDLLRSLAQNFENVQDDDWDDARDALRMLARTILRLDRRIVNAGPLPTPWQESSDAMVMNVRLTVADIEDILEGLEGAVEDAQQLVNYAERSDYQRDRDGAAGNRNDCKERLERVKALLPDPLVTSRS